ncbi:MAG: hypothetical protein ACHWZW_16495 [Spirulina sp.]
MKFTTLSTLSLATVALALCVATQAQAVGCGASKAAPGLTTSLGATGEGGPGSSLTPDSQALAKAAGSFGAVAALLAGGMFLYRKQRPDGAPVEPSMSPTYPGVEVEPVLISESLLESPMTHDDQESETTLTPSR